MKYALIILAALMSFQANAETSYCDHMSDLAASIMRNRQAGVPASKMYKVTENKALQSMVLMAYDKPRFTVKSYINESIEEFRDEIYVLCVIQTNGEGTKK